MEGKTRLDSQDSSDDDLEGLAPTSGHVSLCIPRELLRRSQGGDDAEHYAAIVNLVLTTQEEISDWEDIRKFLANTTMEMLREQKWATSMERLIRVVHEASQAAEELNRLAQERVGFALEKL